MTTTPTRDRYQQIVDKFIGMLGAGVAPWRQPWDSGLVLPHSLATGKGYRGTNLAFLMAVMIAEGYTSSWFLTYNAARQRGGHVRKGEHGWPLLKIDQRPIKNEETGEIESWRKFSQWDVVFNVEQCEGIEAPTPALRTIEPHEHAEQILAGIQGKPQLAEDIDPRAYYRPSIDLVHMPLRSTFKNADSWYAVQFHEYIHSTGHSSRLNRDAVARLEGESQAAFGDADYSHEELVAELGAAFLCVEAGIQNIALDNNAAAYLNSWLNVLKESPRMLFEAATQAQDAADWIMGR